MRRRWASRLGAVVALAVLTAACTGLPEDGPVVEAPAPTGAGADRASDIDAVPPEPGASELEVVKGFLDAMTASPIRTDVARQFLAEDAAAEWNPEASTITYADKLPAQDSGSEIVVRLSDAALLDASGAWKGSLPATRERLSFDIIVEDGEYRIANPRDALIVPAPWFAQRFRQVSLYFFDTSARILVPQPVFVPRGDQLATTLINGLLEGPGDDLRRVARSFLPRGLSVGLSVPVSSDGVAQIALVGDAGPPTPENVERMLAQLAWTLRQDPGITALRVSIGGEELRLPGGDSIYPVDSAMGYDPNGYQASTRLYGLREGLLVSGEGADLSPADGPLAERDGGLRSVSVNLDATMAMGVSEDGTRAVVSPVRDAGATPVVTRVVVDGATDLLPPAWDFTDRAWFVDRTADGARVRYFQRGRLRELDVPGVTGRPVRAFLVSRDATRFVAVVRAGGTDQVRIGRIEVDGRGRISRASPTEVVTSDQEEQLRVTDLAWTTPTTIALLSPSLPGELYEISTVTVDGSPTTADSLSTTVSAPVVELAGSPVPGRPPYAVTRTGLVDASTGAEFVFPDGAVTSLDYVG